MRLFNQTSCHAKLLPSNARSCERGRRREKWVPRKEGPFAGTSKKAALGTKEYYFDWL
jgi:hypothetical protein